MPDMPKFQIPEIRLMPLLWGVVAVAAVLLVIALVLRLTLKRPLIGGEKHLEVKNTRHGSGLEIVRGEQCQGFVMGRKWRRPKTEKLLGRIGRKTIYQPYGAEGHIVVFGGTGKGKTSALLIPTLRAWPGAFFCIDISGDIAANVPCENKLILSPDEPEHSASYNVLARIDDDKISESERVERIEQLVNALLPISPRDSSTQQYFLKKARVLLLAGILALYGPEYDFCDICKTIYLSGLQQLYDLAENSGNDMARSFIQTVKSENEKNISGAKSTLDDHIRLFAQNENMPKVLHRPQTGQPEVRTADLEDSHIFLIVPDAKQEYYAPMQSIVVSQMMGYISGRVYHRDTEQNRILLALDEFASLQHLELLGPMRKFRKNGANICLLTQSLADIDLVYSVDERKVILDNAQYTVVLSARDNDTRTYFSELVGMEDAKKQSTTSGERGGSTSTSYQQEYAISKNTWRSMSDELIVIHDGGYLRLLNAYYYK